MAPPPSAAHFLRHSALTSADGSCTACGAGRDPDGTVPWEIGSEFHWTSDYLHSEGGARRSWLPAKYSLFSSFAGALSLLIERRLTRPVVHVPSYFCGATISLLADQVEVKVFRQIPGGRGPDFDSLDAKPGEAVLAVNLFGRESRLPWDEWATSNSSIFIIEDHTHDPLSSWAQTSTADYCIASLRKTLPVPDGAPIWSPRGWALPRPTRDESPAAALKLSAMLLKEAWLRGGAVDKRLFREAQAAGERAWCSRPLRAASFTRSLLPLLDAYRLRTARLQNAERFLAGLDPRSSSFQALDYRPLCNEVPFGVQLLCGDNLTRNSLRKHLLKNRVFAPIHWLPDRNAQATSMDGRVMQLGERILTIPLDHRYAAYDVDRVLEIIEAFSP